MKRLSTFLLAGLAGMLVLTGCGNSSKDSGKDSGDEGDKDKSVLKVAALESGYGADMWSQIKQAYEKANPDVTVELTVDKKLEDVIGPDMKAGNYPDVILLATGREAGLTETFIKDKNLEDLSDVLEMTVPGEDTKVSEKLIEGFTDTLATNPYNDGKTYLAPMFYSPTGLFYNSSLLEENGWELPKTWDEMWELGDKAKEKGIALFTYPTTGYLDSFMYSLLSVAGGPEFFEDAMTYKEGAWSSKPATEALEIIGKLASYTEPTTVANANDQDFTKNQQLILDNKAIFMPNGTWVSGEMKDAPRADGFKWGLTPLPAAGSGDRYSYTFFEQIWMPAGAENKEEGKAFISYMYSDEAADIFKESGAIQPIKGISDKLDGENKVFYSIYDDDAKVVLGGLENVVSVEGVNLRDTLFGTVDSIVSGDKKVADWQKDIVAATDKLREAAK